ncbi:hypothetical protein [Variovorax sp. dw_954]|uniref:hypothetical protein n=1 Tax=Variovorax sp. dw_954 TaxID=2720078 RepID=UPI00211654A3|nr:hypothetical protein [Variovorax sp. dw_954]
MKDTSFRWALPVAMSLTTVLLLSACGGGGGGGGGFLPPTTSTGNGGGDSGAADPYAGFISYVMALLGMAPETAEAADVSKFDPPATSDTKEAVATP